MPRENSLSDSEGRSLTPDLDDADVVASSPIYGYSPLYPTPPPALRINTDGTLHESHPHAHAHFNTPQQPASASAPRQSTSIRSPVRSTRTAGTARTRASRRTQNTQTPKERFKSTVRKIIQLHRSTSVLVNGDIGAEPGIDPRRNSARLNYGHIHQECVVQVVDYSSVRCTVRRRMDNREFLALMNGAKYQREPWVKVRWINIGGVSWDLISALTLKYDLHPLAIEDVLHATDHSRSKADYYSKHLFIRAVCHRLLTENDSADDLPETFSSDLTETELPYDDDQEEPIPRSESPSEMYEEGDADADDPEKGAYVTDEHTVLNGVSRKSTLRFLENDAQRPGRDGENRAQKALERMQWKENRRASRAKNEVTLDQLKKEERVPVSVKPMYIFLMRDGTVISMHASPSIEFTAPIAARLQQRDTLLRRSADASMLLQSLLDLIVDQAMEVVGAYHDKIRKFEKQVLLKRKMNIVTNLHILSSDLVMHKRTLAPLKMLIYGLRRYDLDRCAALIDPTDPTYGASLGGMNGAPFGAVPYSAFPGKPHVVGYMSHKSKIYLADVHDHAEYIINSLDMFASITENLINYTFNMASYEMSEVMRQLTIATIIFLPLTFLCGYFGMNFTDMSSLDGSDSFFWVLAVPVCATIVPLFLYADIQRAVHYMKKKVLAKRVVRNFNKESKLKQT